MKRLKVLTLVGTRPELIKLSRVIAALDAATDHVLVHSGQNFDPELSQVFFDELEIRPPAGFATETTSSWNVSVFVPASARIARPSVRVIVTANRSPAGVIPFAGKRPCWTTWPWCAMRSPPPPPTYRPHLPAAHRPTSAAPEPWAQA